MKFIILSRLIFILFIINSSNSNLDNLKYEENSYYYEEKYFRILSNNYDSIDPGNFWESIKENDKVYGIGFNAKRDFGSLILLKDWSMYNFKLTKIIFRTSVITTPKRGASSHGTGMEARVTSAPFSFVPLKKMKVV